MKNEFLKLTDAVYKMLEYFPDSDPLKSRAKEKSLAIMDNLALIFGTEGWASFQKEKIQNQTLEDIDTFLGYLKIAKSQGWLSPINFLIISNEYQKICQQLSQSTERLPKIEIPNVLQECTQIVKKSVLSNTETPAATFSDRQKKIVKFLEDNEKAQVMDLQTVLPTVTKRTIRRDLDELLKSGKISRLGEFNQIFYKIA